MLTLQGLTAYLSRNAVDFWLIRQATPIICTHDAQQYFDLNLAAPALVVQADDELMLLITSAKRKKIDFAAIKSVIGITKLKLADKNQAEAVTGYKVGTIPLIGVDLPCIFDNMLLNFEYIYGGSGDEFYTLKIDPKAVKHLNNVRFTFD